ncbi:MAG: DNA integrity scanning protein DisA nucleotide-binding domain protein [Deltaproteobacteria bacterium]|nr:DNA integrity scanning protein DisA nucleotide-binding domain protein [Deltaproteobacteria bacterium]
MADVSKFDREFLRSVLTLAGKSDVDHLLFISDHPLSTGDMRGRPLKKKLIYAVTSDKAAEDLKAQHYQAVAIPSYGYARVEKVKVALIAAASENLLKEGETVLCLTGHGEARAVDTLIKINFGEELEDQVVTVDAMNLGSDFNSQVVEALIQLAMEVGQQGYEGHSVGTIIVVGDSTAVMEKSRQLTLNPFQGISEAERNVLDPKIRDAVKTFAILDGAFIIREDGVVLAAGRYLQASSDKAKVPLGLGARHAGSAAMTMETKAVAIVVSQTSGAVRVFKDGEIVLELHQTARRK